MDIIEYPDDYYTDGSGNNFLWFILDYHTGWFKFDIQVDSTHVLLLISGLHNVLVNPENGVLKSRIGSKERFGALCEKGNSDTITLSRFQK